MTTGRNAPSTFELIIQFSDVWAWPIVVILVVVLFRKPAARFIDRVIFFRGAGVSVNLSDKMAWIAEQYEASKYARYSKDKEMNMFQIENRKRIEGADPKIHVLRCWAALESSMREASDELGIDFKTRSPKNVATKLLENDYIDVDDLEAIEGLFEIRNELEHRYNEVELDASTAGAYCRLSQRLTQKISGSNG